MRKAFLQLSLMLFVSAAAWAQSRTLTGRVVGKDGEPLAGASIMVKGSTKGVVSDQSGNFKIDVAGNNKVVLTVKSLGHKEQEVPVAPTAQMVSVELEQSGAAQLDEVVVNIGYTSVSKKEVAAAVSSVTAKDLQDFPVSTAAEALAGKLAGVSVKAAEGSPGADIQILVRGGTSLTQDNAPLYIVDGVPLNNALSIISPTEIQSIDVLKDLASTAIYGARGANGVVLITTKSGKKGRTIVSFDAYGGARTITNELDVLKPYDFVKYQYELNRLHYNGFVVTDTAAINGFTGKYGPYPDFEIYKSFPMYDWQDVVFGRNAVSQTQVLTVNGGTETTTYNFSMNNTREEGIMLNSDLKRTLATFRFDHKISNKLKLGLNMRYSRQVVNGAGTAGTGSGSNSRLKYSVRFQPYIGLVNFEEYDPNAIFDNTINLSNPLTSALQDKRLAYSNNLITSAQLQYNVVKGLTVRSVLGYNVGDNRTDNFSGAANFQVSGRNSSSQYASQPYISLSTNKNISINNSNTLEWAPNLGKSHRLNLLAGQEINSSNGDAYNQTIKYFPAAVTAEQAFANVQQANPPSGAIQPTPTTDVTGERLFSFFGRAMYSYKNRYSLNLMMRRDGSSKFATTNRWGTFPSAQFAWRLTEEKFLKENAPDWLTNLKLRASYGTAGNNRVSNDRLYQTIFTTSATDAGYAASDNAQTSGLYSANLANPDLKWETTISRNLGLDVDLFNNRLTLSLDGYINRTNDLLLQTNVPQQTGYVSQFQNIGSTQNKGVELQLSGTIARTRNFTYNSSFNISSNRNSIVALQGGVTSYMVSSGWGQNGEDFLVEVGKPVGQYYGYVSDGYYTLDDFDKDLSNPAAYKWVLKPGVANSSVINGTTQVYPGMMKLRKLGDRKDSVVRTTDRQVLGNVQPKFFGGWNHQLAFKNFDMSLFFNYSYGNKTYNANKIEFSSVYQATGNNLLSSMKDRWQTFDEQGNFMSDWDQIAKANQDAKTYMPTRGLPVLRSDAIEDGSFLRITNVTIGYSLPRQLLLRTHLLTKVRVYATVNNLYTFTKYTGYDPEASTRRSNPLTPGVDHAAYPRSRYILGGINVVF
ncbi:TonB-dependent receptor [Paraflavisolibacter sp. H34]|uniref:SusC/RagA family TonB-linked outer membrane protein n=1 Tax=Huijunlia imazamoxiresistens TaxID=3127457 RepID=UPI003015BB72